jgi:hypothetical protein
VTRASAYLSTTHYDDLFPSYLPGDHQAAAGLDGREAGSGACHCCAASGRVADSRWDGAGSDLRGDVRTGGLGYQGREVELKARTLEAWDL